MLVPDGLKEVPSSRFVNVQIYVRDMLAQATWPDSVGILIPVAP